MGLSSFPASLTRALTGLTALSLRDNDFKRIPAALCQIATLQILDMANNARLKLEAGDGVTLAALPFLRGLHLSPSGFLSEEDEEGSRSFTKDHVLTQWNMSVWDTIKERLPHLAMLGI